jgi:hypothetical protein
MVATGSTIESPKIGQAVTFLATARDTDGRELVMKARMRPGAFVPPHRHIRQDLFERLFRLGAQGKVNKLGAPSPLISAQLVREFREEFFYLATVPLWLQRILAGARP